MMKYDVVVIGGSLSGAASATLLLREFPELKVLIVEKSPRFTRRVGEATAEISGCFLGRVLGMTTFMNETQLVKQGMRFWFANKDTKTLDEASEIGPRYHTRLPAYQLDRAVFDEEVLRRACAAGATLLRLASITGVQLNPGGGQIVTIRHDDTTETVSARWVVDASGVAALLARQEGWWRQNTEHPTAACWGRWKGVKDWDGRELAEKFPVWAEANYGTRGTATNHLMGDGWWSWWIPLKGGDVSVGAVFDQRLLEWPQDGGTPGEKLKSVLLRHPVAREMLADAELVEADTHWRKNLAYFTTTYAGDGFVIVGDASAFMDPFYSPGMDWISFTVSASVDVIATQLRGKPLAARIEKHNHDFTLSYRSWFEAVYKDKYEYLGEFDLFKLAFQLDLGLYYMGIVSQPFKFGTKALIEPPFTSPISGPFLHFMRFYNRRFAQIGRRRRKLGMLGRTNKARRHLIRGFTISWSDFSQIFTVIRHWMWAELTESCRTLMKSRRTQE